MHDIYLRCIQVARDVDIYQYLEHLDEDLKRSALDMSGGVFEYKEILDMLRCLVRDRMTSESDRDSLWSVNLRLDAPSLGEPVRA